MKFREYQLQIIEKAHDIIVDHRFVYLAMEVRTGKTLTSLGLAEKLGASNVLFLTKKKAISSIVGDGEMLSADYSLTVINYESAHKLPDIKWDVIILDEAHGLGAFPKPSKRAKFVKDLIHRTGALVVLLSGTPTPESYSQIYHQVYGIASSPFSRYKNFYRFSDDHVRVTKKKISGFDVRDYSDGLESIMEAMAPYMISYSQKDAGFASKIEEEVLYVDMDKDTIGLTKELKRDLVVEIGDEVILADTGVKLMGKIHQICSGTVKFESGKSMVLDLSKANYIKKRFSGNRIGVFYKFKAELDALKAVFGDDLCTKLEEFDESEKPCIALQIVSGREGISLRNADYLIYYNIDFSATSYWQSRDRMTTKDRKYNKVFWVFSRGGIESKVYSRVKNKKDFTLSHFRTLE